MKKRYLFTVALLTLAMALSGCQSGTNEINSPSTSNNDSQVESHAPVKEYITMESAMYLSASSQKINSGEVTFTSVALNEGDESKYEVEFVHDGYVYNVDVNAETGEINGEQREELAPAEESNVAANNIGREAAIKAAFEKAGFPELTANDVERLLVKLDREDGRVEYEIDFIYNGMEYEVDILASDGSILDFEKEPADDDDYRDDDDDDNDDDDDDVKVDVNSGDYISKDEAVALALAHAQLSADDIKGLRVKLERDDGKVQYEIEFYSASTEYDYDIDATSGAIINFDRDAEYVSLPDPSYPEESTLISKESAKLAAFEHAGVNEADVYDFEIELENKRGVSKYEIEFKCGEYEFEYDIDATDGSVLNHAKEIDD